jgi:hypothetical protein
LGALRKDPMNRESILLELYDLRVSHVESL